MSEELFQVENEDEDMQDQDKQTEKSKKYLAFISDGLQYAIDVGYVDEIKTNETITLLPKVPKFIKGVMNLRGQIKPVVDIRVLMNRPAIEYNSETCIIVLEVNSVSLGILVDGVSRVIDLFPDMISPPPSNINQELVYGIANVEGVVNLMLDCEKLVNWGQHI